MKPWDDIFGKLPYNMGTEAERDQHKALWESIRKRGGQMTEKEEQELNRLFNAIYPNRFQMDEDFDDDDDPLAKGSKPRQTKSVPSQIQTKRKKPMFQNLNKYHKKLGSSPIILWFLGILSLLLWAAGTVTQIQTSEYLALGSHERVANVAWGVLMQPWLLLSGQADISVVTAWEYGWVVELVTLVFGLALAAAVTKIALANPHLAKWFVIAGIILLILNSWADYSSSPGNNPLVQCLIAIAVGGIVVVGLPLGIGLIEHGFEEL